MTDIVIDLHSHTIHSDGSATPSEIVALAKAGGARAVAITDHDTIAGLDEARKAANEVGVEFVNGVELSAEYGPGTMHILGYFIDPACDVLNEELERLRAARESRNPEIARRLQRLGVEISYEQVAELAGNDVVGRPHFARLLVEKRFAESIQDAFDRFLAKGAAAYVEKKRLSPEKCIGLIHQARGAAVLAHPYQLNLRSDDLDRLVRGLAALGLDGIEAIYSRHSPRERDDYERLARRHGLLVTGGSDYHGTYKPDISLVHGLGDLAVPYSLLDQLRSKAIQ